jgi:hypothetical protein
LSRQAARQARKPPQQKPMMPTLPPLALAAWSMAAWMSVSTPGAGSPLTAAFSAMPSFIPASS